MSTSTSTPLVIGATVLAGALAYGIWKSNETSVPLPPGPKSYPLIGHLFSIPQSAEYIAYMRMCEDLGSDMISLRAFGINILVLSDQEDAVNLLDKRSVTYSDRTVPVMVSEPSLFDWSTLGSLVGYGDRWKTYRRLMNPWLTKNGTSIFQDVQAHTATLFVQRLFGICNSTISSKDLESELLLGLGSTFFRSIYGYEVKSLQDPFIARMQSSIGHLADACLPSNFLVNVIPVLKYVPGWLPGAGWKRTARQWREEKESLLRDTYELATKGFNGGAHEDIIVTHLREEALKLGLSEEQTRDYVEQIAITLYTGGTETTVSTLLMFFMAMVLYPEVQRKAQNEIDSVIGNGRLPGFEDQPQLEYVGRIVRETLRWKPVTPIAFPHTCSQDDTYKGYHIPRGTLVAMTRDPKVYPNPESFEPDRFLDPSIPTSPLFGWGRRRCPGSHIAETALFIFIVSTLSIFEISAAKDNNGNDILPSQKMSNSVILRPEPFKFRLTPRSARHEALLNELAVESQNKKDY